MNATPTLAVGATMPDGTIFAGNSPETGRPMYTTLKDAPLVYTFNEANDYASKLDTHGHKDWRVPTGAELNVLFQNRAAIGGFGETGDPGHEWYWSSSFYNVDGSYMALVQRFSDGARINNFSFNASALRCVRG